MWVEDIKDNLILVKSLRRQKLIWC